VLSDFSLSAALAQFSDAERAALGDFWHPVAYASELGDAPCRVTLLDVDLVLWQHAGALSVAPDQCPHRGSRLSTGWVAEGQLVCPYHGLHFDGQGRCTKVPAQDPQTPISARLQLSTVLCTQRYGLVWVCLSGAPRLPLPEWPALETAAHQQYASYADWQASAGRHVENFNDIAHFAWAHVGTFGAREQPLLLPERIEETPLGLRRTTRVAQAERDTFTDAAIVTEADYLYEFTYPFASSLRIAYPSLGTEWIYSAASPVGPAQTRIFILKARDYGQDEPLAEWIAFQDAIDEEDRRVVEQQRPRAIPLDPAAEGHIVADAWSLAFRRRWASFGVNGPI